MINIGGAWQKGRATRALYTYRLMLDLCEPDRRRKSPPVFHLAQEFYWLNPAKLPNPVQWVNVTRERVKDAVEQVWWLSKDPHPKACNRKVLVPYSEHMQRVAQNRQVQQRRPALRGGIFPKCGQRTTVARYPPISNLTTR